MLLILIISSERLWIISSEQFLWKNSSSSILSITILRQTDRTQQAVRLVFVFVFVFTFAFVFVRLERRSTDILQMNLDRDRRPQWWPSLKNLMHYVTQREPKGQLMSSVRTGSLSKNYYCTEKYLFGNWRNAKWVVTMGTGHAGNKTVDDDGDDDEMRVYFLCILTPIFYSCSCAWI